MMDAERKRWRKRLEQWTRRGVREEPLCELDSDSDDWQLWASDVIAWIDALDAAEARAEEAEAKVCDECDGQGLYILSDETGVKEVGICVCVGETAAYQRLVSERDRLREDLDRANARIRAWTDSTEPPALEDHDAIGPPDIAELIEASPRFTGDRDGGSVDVRLENYEAVVSRSEIVAYGRALAWQQSEINRLRDGCEAVMGLLATAVRQHPAPGSHGEQWLSILRDTLLRALNRPECQGGGE